MCLRRCALAFTAILLAGCANIGLLDQLEDPAGANRSCGADCRIFVTQANFNANLGGAPGADQKCKQDFNNPRGPGVGPWKAMLAVGAPSRLACTSTNCTVGGAGENIDWAMKGNTTYRRPDGTLIGVTNGSGIFASGISNSISSTLFNVWTGLNSNWQINTNCNGWADSTAAAGTTGTSTSLSDTAINASQPGCGSGNHLYCVEQ
ncbi:DUF1554 domain-containing protein [Turneriella parva]|nr:DUF1554 domain-containing protein [Turneriella parva]